MEKEANSWFKSWFDTEQYHELYGHRDEKEAQYFIIKLCDFMKISPGSLCADLACGKGRHSNTLASLGMKVLGLDLSENSIDYAKKNAIPGAEFATHDMRLPLPKNDFSAIFNLFTSFGYFDNIEDDEKVIQNQYEGLKKGGVFIQDYINAEAVTINLPKKETIIKPKTRFEIHKFVEDGRIKKNIKFKVNGEAYDYTENVKIYSMEQLQALHIKAGFSVKHIFGNYALEDFDSKTSPRLIMISEKC
jgi:SAM-dependent methyltransferase